MDSLESTTSLKTFDHPQPLETDSATATSSSSNIEAQVQENIPTSSDTGTTTNITHTTTNESTTEIREVVEEESGEVNEEESTTPVFMERKRHHFSYDANELRRRNMPSSYSTTKTEPESSSGTTSSTINNNINNSSNTSQPKSSHTSSDGGFYECNICFDTATHPVLTLCGHLFCWSCLAQWLNAQSRNPTCPVCKAGCGKDKVIPIYGRGREEKDPRTDPSIPTRPAGQRPPPLRDPNRPYTSIFGQGIRGNNYNYNSTFTSASIGIFPFGISFNFPVGGGANDFQTQSQQNAFMSRLFFMVLSLMIVFLIFSS